MNSVLLWLLAVSFVVGLLPARLLYGLTPPLWRATMYGGKRVLRAAVALWPLGAALVLGTRIHDDGVAPVGVLLMMVLLVGIPVALSNHHGLGKLRVHHRTATAPPAPLLPAPGSAVPAWLVTPPTPLPADPQSLDRSHNRFDRGLRRARTAALVLFGVTYLAGRMLQLGASPDVEGEPSVPGSLLLTLGLAGVLLLMAAPLLRWRAKRSAASHPLPVGSVCTPQDSDRLEQRFPSAPLLRSVNGLSALTVEGLAGNRYWWVTSQKGAVYQEGGLRRTRIRSTCLVWLPGVRLPAVAVRGRDAAQLTEWFGEGLSLENWDFNEQWHVTHEPGAKAPAVALMHPRMMELVIASLPDGATLNFYEDILSISFQRELKLGEVAGVVSLGLRAADLVPMHLLKEHRDESNSGPAPVVAT